MNKSKRINGRLGKSPKRSQRVENVEVANKLKGNLDQQEIAYYEPICPLCQKPVLKTDKIRTPTVNKVPTIVHDVCPGEKKREPYVPNPEEKIFQRVRGGPRRG
jgi:hypothetical protein